MELALASHSKERSKQQTIDSRRGKNKPFLSTIYCLLSTDTRGFSLVEMLIALFILTVAVLGLLDLTITAIRTNMQNDVRNTAVGLTSQTAEVLLARPFDMVRDCGTTPDPTITGASVAAYNALYTDDAANACLVDSDAANDYKKYPNPSQSGQMYNITWAVTSPSTNLKQIQIFVSYAFRGTIYTNSVVSYKHK